MTSLSLARDSKPVVLHKLQKQRRPQIMDYNLQTANSIKFVKTFQTNLMSIRVLHGKEPIGYVYLYQLFLFFSCSVGSYSFCDPMDFSTPGFPILHHLPDLAQTHVHWVGDAIQLSCPLSSPSHPAFNLSSIRVFSNESALCLRWPKYWSFSFNISPSMNIQRLISFRMDWFDLLALRDSQASSSTP